MWFRCAQTPLLGVWRLRFAVCNQHVRNMSALRSWQEAAVCYPPMNVVQPHLYFKSIILSFLEKCSNLCYQPPTVGNVKKKISFFCDNNCEISLILVCSIAGTLFSFPILTHYSMYYGGELQESPSSWMWYKPSYLWAHCCTQEDNVANTSLLPHQDTPLKSSLLDRPKKVFLPASSRGASFLPSLVFLLISGVRAKLNGW